MIFATVGANDMTQVGSLTTFYQWYKMPANLIVEKEAKSEKIGHYHQLDFPGGAISLEFELLPASTLTHSGSQNIGSASGVSQTVTGRCRC